MYLYSNNKIMFLVEDNDSIIYVQNNKYMKASYSLILFYLFIIYDSIYCNN